MVKEIGTPGVKDGGHSGHQPFIISKCFQREPGRLEKAIVKITLILHGNLLQACWNGKYDMEIFHRNDLFLTCMNPFFPFGVLTLGAMPVTTTVIADVDVTTFRTYLNMPSQSAGSAHGDMLKGFPYGRYDLMASEEFIFVTSDDSTDIKRRSHSYLQPLRFLGGKRTSIGWTCSCGSLSIT